MSTAALSAGPHAKPSILEKLRDYVLPLAAISVIFVMLVPLPAACLDMLLALSFPPCRSAARSSSRSFPRCSCF
jgi:hypothetical protein